MNRVQFQPGVSLPEFMPRYGTQAQCEAALAQMRWPEGFRCPRCQSAEHYVVGHGARRLYQCKACRHQASLTSGTVMDNSKLPLQTNDKGHPMRVKLGAIKTFSREAIATWARANLLPGCDVRSDGLACFAGVIDAGCAHSFIVVGSRKPRERPQFTWVNTVLGNLKTMVGGAHKWFRFGKYAPHYLGAFAYRFNNRFDLGAMLTATISQAATRRPTRERQVRGMAELHD